MCAWFTIPEQAHDAGPPGDAVVDLELEVLAARVRDVEVVVDAVRDRRHQHLAERAPPTAASAYSTTAPSV